MTDRRKNRSAEERERRYAVLALDLVADRAEEEGFEGWPYSPPPMAAGVAAQNRYRMSYHAGIDRRKG